MPRSKNLGSNDHNSDREEPHCDSIERRERRERHANLSMPKSRTNTVGSTSSPRQSGKVYNSRDKGTARLARTSSRRDSERSLVASPNLDPIPGPSRERKDIDSHKIKNQRRNEARSSRFDRMEISPRPSEKKIVNAEAKVKALEQKLEERETSLSKSKKSEKALKEALTKAEYEKESFKEKWMDLKRIKKTLKEEVEKQAEQISVLKGRLLEAEKIANRAISGLIVSDRSSSHLVKNEQQPPTSSIGQSQDNGSIFDDMMNNLKELLESQLQCSICNDVYAFSVTITCGHTFCSECIEEWKSQQTSHRPTCPICRAMIISQVKTTVLDDFIDKFVEGFVPDSYKLVRKELLEERRLKERNRTLSQRDLAREGLPRIFMDFQPIRSLYSSTPRESYQLTGRQLTDELTGEEPERSESPRFSRSSSSSRSSNNQSHISSEFRRISDMEDQLELSLHQRTPSTIASRTVFCPFAPRNRIRTPTSSTRSLLSSMSGSRSQFISRSRSRSPSSTRNEQSHSQNASTPEMADEDENRTHDNPSSDATYSPGNSTRSISHGTSSNSRNSTPSIRNDFGNETDDTFGSSHFYPFESRLLSGNSDDDQSPTWSNQEI